LKIKAESYHCHDASTYSERTSIVAFIIVTHKGYSKAPIW
jgi:hypothetical protein